MKFVLEFHRNGRLMKGINTTFIVLILKVESPQTLNDFRLIPLVGSLHKILAKIFGNRLHQVIGGVIFDAQSAFVKIKIKIKINYEDTSSTSVVDNSMTCWQLNETIFCQTLLTS